MARAQLRRPHVGTVVGDLLRAHHDLSALIDSLIIDSLNIVGAKESLIRDAGGARWKTLGAYRHAITGKTPVRLRAPPFFSHFRGVFDRLLVSHRGRREARTANKTASARNPEEKLRRSANAGHPRWSSRALGPAVAVRAPFSPISHSFALISRRFALICVSFLVFQALFD